MRSDTQSDGLDTLLAQRLALFALGTNTFVLLSWAFRGGFARSAPHFRHSCFDVTPAPKVAQDGVGEPVDVGPIVVDLR